MHKSRKVKEIRKHEYIREERRGSIGEYVGKGGDHNTRYTMTALRED